MIKVRVPKKDEEKKEGEVKYPADHKPGMVVPKNGSCCKNCEYLSGQKCTNKYFIKWKGDDLIPAPVDEYCSDFYEPADKK